MSSVTKYYCDVCGKEIDKSNAPPWARDLCPEHRKSEDSDSTMYMQTSDQGKNFKVWI